MSLFIEKTIQRTEIKNLDSYVEAKFKTNTDFYSNYSNDFFIAKGDLLIPLYDLIIGEEYCTVFTSLNHKIKKDTYVVFYMNKSDFGFLTK